MTRCPVRPLRRLQSWLREHREMTAEMERLSTQNGRVFNAQPSLRIEQAIKDAISAWGTDTFEGRLVAIADAAIAVAKS